VEKEKKKIQVFDLGEEGWMEAVDCNDEENRDDLGLLGEVLLFKCEVPRSKVGPLIGAELILEMALGELCQQGAGETILPRKSWRQKKVRAL
jgi:hypothetical protein